MKIERKEILDEVKKQLWLAGPMILVCVFQNLQMTTLIFVGHLNQELLLAGASLALSIINVTGFNVLMGMSSALDTFCGQAYGAKQYHMVGIYTQAQLFARYAIPSLFANGILRSCYCNLYHKLG
uniref:Protein DETOXIFICATION 16-like n=1 Tax=Cicer arietinum TaxID=3827 RepID=A0A3Q7XZC3_CICAR|nr:protein DETOXIFICATION 16-like [Cicer arietinum]